MKQRTIMMILALTLLLPVTARGQVSQEPPNRIISFITKVFRGAKSGIGRATEVAKLIVHWSSSQGVDPLLVLAVIDQESDFRNGRTSYRGAIGYMQVEPTSVCKGGGCKAARSLQNPSVNIHYGSKILADSMSCFARDASLKQAALGYYKTELGLGLAAYNGGCGKMEKALKNPDSYGEFFRQTTAYAQSVSSLYGEYRRRAETEPLALNARADDWTATLIAEVLGEPSEPGVTTLSEKPYVGDSQDVRPQTGGTQGDDAAL